MTPPAEATAEATATRRERLKAWAASLKTDLAALRLAVRDPRVPRRAKWLAGATVAYAVSPIDLIPDWIPVLGHLDDLILVPAGIAAAIRMIPRDVWDELRATAAKASG